MPRPMSMQRPMSMPGQRPMQQLMPGQMSMNGYPNWHPMNWSPQSQMGAGVGVFVIIIVIVIIIYFSFSPTSLNFTPKIFKRNNIVYRPKSVRPHVNWIKQNNFNNDDRTADEYYDDRTFTRNNNIASSNNKARFSLKLPETSTGYRKFTEKSAY